MRGVEWSLGAAGPVLGAVDAGELAWQDRALCAQTDPEIFFPEKGGGTRTPKMVCRQCPVRAECLQYALENNERFGIWGGLSERQRRRLSRQAGQASRAEQAAERQEHLRQGRKVCSHCQTPRPLTDFHNCKNTADGRASWCKECVRARNERQNAA